MYTLVSCEAFYMLCYSNKLFVLAFHYYIVIFRNLESRRSYSSRYNDDNNSGDPYKTLIWLDRKYRKIKVKRNMLKILYTNLTINCFKFTN